jgi:hypothetical protein
MLGRQASNPSANCTYLLQAAYVECLGDKIRFL